MEMWWIKLIFILTCIAVIEAVNNSLPIEYEVFLHTDIHQGDFEFGGKVKILLEILDDTATIQLHQDNLVITRVEILGTEEYFYHSQDNENKLLIIGFNSSTFQKDQNYSVEIEFSGTFRDEFLNSYEDGNEKFWFLTLSFHSVPAYTVFPSIHADGLRSAFRINIEHHSSYNAVSNEEKNEAIDEELPGYKISKFTKTDPIQTSSLFVFVSNFKSITANHVEIYGRKNLIENNYFNDALDIANETYGLFKNYFNLTYELPRIRNVAIPGIIAERANYGLIFYNEQDVIYDSDTATTWKKNEIFQIMCRGFAQQFFGNIIGTASESDSFITDGLAKFYEVILNLAEPEKRTMDLFNVKMLHNALEIDSSFFARELLNAVNMPANEFYSFSSTKTMSVLRMLESIIGSDNFKEGVRSLLENYKFQLLSRETFYEAFQSATQIKIDEFFNSWISQPGYPIVTVADFDSTSMTLKQNKYNTTSTCYDNPIWHIPITFLTSDGLESDDKIIWLTEREQKIDIPESDWIILNVNQNCYYRVNYDERHAETWNKLIDEMLNGDLSKIPVENRAALMNDAFNIALISSGSGSKMTTLLNLLSYLKREVDYVPWRAATDILKFLDMTLFHDESDSYIHSNFTEFMIEIVEPFYKHYGTSLRTGESVMERKARNLAIFWACRLNIASCREFVDEKFDYYLHNAEVLEADLRDVVLCDSMRSVNYSTYKHLVSKMLKSDFDRSALIKALACKKDSEWIINDFLVHIENVTAADKREMLMNSLQNYEYGAYVGMGYIKNFLIALSESELYYILNVIVRQIWNTCMLEKLNLTIGNLYTATKLNNETGQEFIRIAEIHVNWMAKNRDHILAWLSEKSITPETTQEITTIDSTTETEASSTTTDGSFMIKPCFLFATWAALLITLINL